MGSIMWIFRDDDPSLSARREYTHGIDWTCIFASGSKLVLAIEACDLANSISEENFILHIEVSISRMVAQDPR